MIDILGIHVFQLKQYLALACLLMNSFLGYSQDLSLNELVFPTNQSSVPIHPGDNLSFYFSVQNSNAQPSSNSNVYFCLSNILTPFDLVVIGEVCIQGINGNDVSELEQFVFRIPQHLQNQSYNLHVVIDPFNSVIETDEMNNHSISPNLLAVSNQTNYNRCLPYPMLFVHGLNSSYEMWNQYLDYLDLEYGFQRGGIFNFCLNGDSDLETGSLSDILDFTDYSGIKPSDIYLINFDVNPDGSIGNNDVQSNQSAIVKQGAALEQAIDSILSISGADKVVLVGHSMGGLCAREYIQRHDLTVNNVGKLCTIFTPHGGSNSTTWGSVSFVNGIDEWSEAVRDLRYSYSNGYEGAYLFGGLESDDEITGMFFDFNNVDVNCNGSTNDQIIGLNLDNYPGGSLSSSCIIGVGSFTGGDGVVSDLRSNLNNFVPSAFADTFVIDTPDEYGLTDILHTDALQDGRWNIVFDQSIDEPKASNHAYKIEKDTYYFGKRDKQSCEYLDCLTLDDLDTYTFDVTTLSVCTFILTNISEPSCIVEMRNAQGQLLASTSNLNKSNLELSATVNAGTYYITVITNWNSNDYQFPYCFHFTLIENYVTIAEQPQEKEIEMFPNPAKEYLSFKNLPNSRSMVTLFNLLGEVVYDKVEIDELASISIENLQMGYYIVELLIGNEVIYHGCLIKE